MAKILIVEDEQTIASTIKYNLHREGYNAFFVLDGEAALAAFEKTQPDLVVLDLMLPKIDGLTVCRRLRQISSTPVIMLTARAEEVDKLVGLEVGADDYMTKPFSMRELISRVKAILRRVEMDRRDARPDQQVLPVVKVADLTISAARHEVWKGDTLIELAPRQFELLLFLASHRREVFSRDVLLEKVWGYSFLGDTRTVDVHVRGIRAKLGDDGPTSSYIETIPRVGYRFR